MFYCDSLGLLCFCFVLFCSWCFSSVICYFRLLSEDNVRRQIIEGKIIEKIWGHIQTPQAAVNEPHSHLLQGQSILYIICMKKVELRPTSLQKKKKKIKKICWDITVLCPLKSFCNSCPDLSFCLVYPCNSFPELHKAEVKHKQGGGFALEILIVPGTFLVSEITYTTQTKAFYENNYWVGSRFQYLHDCNFVSLLLGIAY